MKDVMKEHTKPTLCDRMILLPLIWIMLKIRWAYFHLNPRYKKFFVSKTEAHFEDMKTRAIYSDYTVLWRNPEI